MTANVANQVAYIKSSRLFPEDQKQLLIELTNSYVDIANAINTRVIGIFSKNKAAITGESWFISGSSKQQTLRQIYTFSSTGNIPHGLDLTELYSFSPNCYGVYTDGTNYYGAIFGSNTAIAGQISFYVDPANIVLLSGGGAPSITSGLIVLEWISKV